MERTPYGTMPDGRQVESFTLRNKNGMEVRCISYGCRITHIIYPDGTDVALGFDDLAGYLADDSSQGALTGRYAGRIEGARFEVDGVEYQLRANAGADYLHGTLGYQVYQGEAVGENAVAFSFTSPDGEDGFPGNLAVRLTYTLTDEDELRLEYHATTDKATHLNLTNHCYFNLAGYAAGTLEGQLLTIPSALFLAADENLLPDGRLAETAGGVFDFTTEKSIARDINASDPQIVLAKGYDHSYVVEHAAPGLALAAVARDAGSARSLRVYTTEMDVHLYTSNFLDGSMVGKAGVPLRHQSAFCLETQHFPATPSHPDFPTTLLRPGQKFESTTVWKFGY